ncbi:hypothetical protein [Aquamicrobium sp.]
MALFTAVAGLVTSAISVFMAGGIGTPLLSTNFEEYNPEGCE